MQLLWARESAVGAWDSHIWWRAMPHSAVHNAHAARFLMAAHAHPLLMIIKTARQQTRQEASKQTANQHSSTTAMDPWASWPFNNAPLPVTCTACEWGIFRSSTDQATSGCSWDGLLWDPGSIPAHNAKRDPREVGRQVRTSQGAADTRKTMHGTRSCAHRCHHSVW